jgi:hypothetical protein
MNMANGREGLVNPGLTGQATFRPLPFDARFASTASLNAIAASNRLFGPSEMLTSQVNTLTPQQQHALNPPSSVYTGVSRDWTTNRLNLAMQRKRETSIYAIK